MLGDRLVPMDEDWVGHLHIHSPMTNLIGFVAGMDDYSFLNNQTAIDGVAVRHYFEHRQDYGIYSPYLGAITIQGGPGKMFTVVADGVTQGNCLNLVDTFRRGDTHKLTIFINQTAIPKIYDMAEKLRVCNAEKLSMTFQIEVE